MKKPSVPNIASLSEEYKEVRNLYQQQRYTEAVQALTALCKKINETDDMSLAVTLPEIIRQSNPTELDNAMAKTFLAIYKDKPEESASFDYYLFTLESVVENVLKEPKKPIEAASVAKVVSENPPLEKQSDTSKLAKEIPVVKLSPEALIGDKGKLNPDTLRDYLGQFKDPVEKLKVIRQLFDTIYDNKENQYRESIFFGFTRIRNQHIQILRDEALNIVKQNRDNINVRSFVIDIKQNGDLFDWSPSRINFNPTKRTRRSAFDIYSDDHAMTIRQTFARAKIANPFKASNPIDALFRRLFNTNNQFNKVPLRDIVDYLADKNTPLEHVQYLLEPKGLFSRERNVLKELADNPTELIRFLKNCSPEIIKTIGEGKIKIMTKANERTEPSEILKTRQKLENIFDGLSVVSNKALLKEQLKKLSGNLKEKGYSISDNYASFEIAKQSLRNFIAQHPHLADEIVTILAANMIDDLKSVQQKLFQYQQNSPLFIQRIDHALKMGTFNLSEGTLEKLGDMSIYSILNKINALLANGLEKIKDLYQNIRQLKEPYTIGDIAYIVQLLNTATEIEKEFNEPYNLLHETFLDLNKPDEQKKYVQMKSLKRGTPSSPDPVQDKDEMGGRKHSGSVELPEEKEHEIKMDKEKIKLRSSQKPFKKNDLPTSFLKEEDVAIILKRSKEINDKIISNLGEYFLPSDLVYQIILSGLNKLIGAGKGGIPSEKIKELLDRLDARADMALSEKKSKVNGILKRANGVLADDPNKLDRRQLENLLKAIKASLNECDSLKDKFGKYALPSMTYLQFDSVEKRLKLLEMDALAKLVEKNLESDTPSPEYQKMLDKAMDQFVFEDQSKPIDQQGAKPSPEESTRQQEEKAKQIIEKIDSLLEKDLKLPESRKEEIKKEFNQIKALVDPELGMSPAHYLSTLQIIEHELNNAVVSSPQKTPKSAIPSDFVKDTNQDRTTIPEPHKPERPPSWAEKSATPPDEDTQSKTSPPSPTESKKQ